MRGRPIVKERRSFVDCTRQSSKSKLEDLVPVRARREIHNAHARNPHHSKNRSTSLLPFFPWLLTLTPPHRGKKGYYYYQRNGRASNASSSSKAIIKVGGIKSKRFLLAWKRSKPLTNSGGGVASVTSPVAPLPHRGRARPRPYYSPRLGWGASTDPVLLRVCAATLPVPLVGGIRGADRAADSLRARCLCIYWGKSP